MQIPTEANTPAHGLAENELAARWLALLFLAGGAFTAGAMVFLPVPDSVDVTATALLGLAAGLIGAALWLVRRDSRPAPCRCFCPWPR